MFCKKCGKEIDNNASFCAFCGEKITATETTTECTGTLCPKCSSHNITTQIVPNKTKRRFIKTIVIFLLFILTPVILGYINRNYSFMEGAIAALFVVSIPVVIVGSVIFKIIYKFIPEPYDTMFICGDCGNNWRNRRQ